MSASRYEEVAKKIRAQISDGTIGPGERLPVESALASNFGVSRSTIREALRLLGSEGLIQTTRGVLGGSFVVEVGTKAVSEYLDGRLRLLADREAITADEVQEMREVLEAAAAGLAAKRSSPKDVSELREALEQELEFHTALLSASQNRLLELLSAPVLRLAAETAAELPAEDDHERILERIEAGDPEGAAGATAEHLGRLAGRD